MQTHIRGQIRGGTNIRGTNRQPINAPIIKPAHHNGETKIVNMMADKSGCAHYRVIWPSYILNSEKEYIVSNVQRVVPIEQWYDGLDVVRCQRQVSTEQRKSFENIRFRLEYLAYKIHLNSVLAKEPISDSELSVIN